MSDESSGGFGRGCMIALGIGAASLLLGVLAVAMICGGMRVN